MRFIDVRSLVEFLTKLEEAGEEHISFGDLKKFIYEQCAAYDVDKVVEQLKKILLFRATELVCQIQKLLCLKKRLKL